jgi:tungstate transport system substrate-binding protein
LLSLRKTIFAFIAAFGTFFFSHAIAQEKSIIVASTTSTVDTGLFDYLLPIFTQKTGIAVKVLELGTGHALDAGRRGEADVVFVHAKIPEIQFVVEGNGVKRFPVMYNDFVLIGPKSDPAGIKGMDDVAKAFQTITSYCSRDIEPETASAPCNAASGWVGSCVITINMSPPLAGHSILCKS